jgi:hemoglobin
MTRRRDAPSWNLADAVGGLERLERIVTDFYERVFEDPIIGFFFDDSDLEHIVEMQVEYLRARLGTEDVEYTGESIRRAHDDLPILDGHFDRRHQILKDVLDEYEIPDEVHDAWIELDASLRDLVLRTGESARDEMLDDED